jgi:hypothetical protein
MAVRTAVVLLAVLGLTAFAPAPFPRTQRQGPSPEITLQTFQGRWRITSLVTSCANGQHVPFSWPATHVRISGNRWDFLNNDSLIDSRNLSIDPKKKPAHLNFTDDVRKGVGLIRRQGAQVQVMYTWGDEASRANSFEPPPDGHWLITLQRD